mmetsp:Transcript_22594/g.28965  ORF Transcript_22594/g.28965 Transcript_22594/m.28965 type:complete len:233 (-) Transcript_22594:79-777(-)
MHVSPTGSHSHAESEATRSTSSSSSITSSSSIDICADSNPSARLILISNLRKCKEIALSTKVSLVALYKLVIPKSVLTQKEILASVPFEFSWYMSLEEMVVVSKSIVELTGVTPSTAASNIFVVLISIYCGSTVSVQLGPISNSWVRTSSSDMAGISYLSSSSPSSLLPSKANMVVSFLNVILYELTRSSAKIFFAKRHKAKTRVLRLNVDEFIIVFIKKFLRKLYYSRQYS